MPRWTVEARAKQAELIRRWKPWQQSTGPRQQYERSEELRSRQSEAIRQWRPWESSTGPTSAAGKAASSQNARQLPGNFASLESAMNQLLNLQQEQIQEISEIFLEKLNETNYQTIHHE